jgi:hypothetical protein
MQETSQEPSKPKNPAGYRPLVPEELSRSGSNSAAAYVAAAAGLGLVAGIAIAFSASHGTGAPRVSEALTTHTSGLTALPAVYTGPAPSLLSKVDTQKKAGVNAPALTPVDQDSTKKTAGAHKKRRSHRLWPWHKRKGNVAKRAPYVSPNPQPAPTALELATAAAASGPFFVGIEGEVTVANYDVAAGKIQTYEGSNFLLDRTSAGSSAIPWQDFPFNVHYRCDEAGNCTLVHGSATAIARLTR